MASEGEEGVGQQLALQESPAALANLPQEIVTEILARLPVECLLRFRCVSKSWLALISSPSFMNTQIEISNNNHDSAQNRVVLIALFPGLDKICSVHSIVRENSCLSLAEVNNFCKIPCKSPRILGHCNGLLCLSTVNFKLLMWNPSARKSWEFPDSFVQINCGCYIRYGFGYDERKKDFKVVKIFSIDTGGGKHENIVRVYSFRANSWTTMPGFNSGYIYGKFGVFLNGKLHWEIRHTNKSGVSWEIVSLDLGIDRYGTMALPSSENGKCYWNLGISRGMLFACCIYYPKRMNVWVMKEYGLVESWTKVVSISLPEDHRGYISVLHMTENGDEFLLKLGTQLVVYDSRNGSFKQLEDLAFPCSLEVQSATYTESLALMDIGVDNRN